MIQLENHERVRRGGEDYGIGDKVYSTNNSHFGVGYIQKIHLYGVDFGFRALIDSTILNKPAWYDSRNMTKDAPLTMDDVVAD